MPSDKRRLMHKILKMTVLHRYRIIKALSGNDIYFGQPPILDYLAEHGNCAQNELARNMRVSAASVAVSIKRMCKTGLIEKTPDPSDMRINRISLTEKGKTVQKKCREECDRIDERMFSVLSDEELAQLENMLDRMIDNASYGVGSDEEVLKYIKEKEKCEE